MTDDGMDAPRRRTGSRLRIAGCLAWAVLGAHSAHAIGDELLDLSLEELMDVEVTSVSKKAERRQQTAAAITVISAEDIRRGGFTSVPEALRTVPGVQVARIDASRWAISIRGFRTEFANKLLVLIDGRPVYTPAFGGVFWAEQNLPMEDIARIEVIRGPGGAIWGANAVNGVINILTRHTEDTQGSLLSVRVGTQEYGATARNGGRLGESTTYRLSARGERILDYDFDQDYAGNDEWANLRLGVRTDTQIDERSRLDVHLDFWELDTERGVGLRNPAPPFNVLGFDRVSERSRGAALVVGYDRTSKTTASSA